MNVPLPLLFALGLLVVGQLLLIWRLALHNYNYQLLADYCEQRIMPYLISSEAKTLPVQLRNLLERARG